MNPSYQQQSRELIEGLKAVCVSNGLGNDGNEYTALFEYLLKDYNKDNGGKYAESCTRARWPRSWPTSQYPSPSFAR